MSAIAVHNEWEFHDFVEDHDRLTEESHPREQPHR
jgi:hypothetical protein